MKNARLPLGDLEHELLTILWKHGEMTATAVRKHVARKLKDPTIRTVLRRLEEKGYVTHSVVSGTFIYRAKESADATAATAVSDKQVIPAIAVDHVGGFPVDRDIARRILRMQALPGFRVQFHQADVSEVGTVGQPQSAIGRVQKDTRIDGVRVFDAVRRGPLPV